MSRILATLSVVALLVHSQAGFEFTQIMGFVTFDDAKATPIQGAEVRIIGLDSAITTKSGEFSIKANVLMIGQKITLQVAMPGWRISTSQPIEIIVPKDSVANPLRIKMRKDLTTTPARAPSSGIFVSRIVGEIGDERRATTASIWLTAAGEYNYVIDSIVIRHQPGPLFSGGSGAVKPDATYSFMFRVHADQTEPLIPALRLDRNDRREVWFTLGLAPDDSFSTSGGSVDVRLQYHIENSGAAGV